ncbi:MAG: hypothetical protein H6715_05690 [Myxococcales bacterium]|nr:hypothetical protein [Myxococcales bacterium]MCB9707907.1 hypothetical protein [Myxococcales bacterium]
MKYCLVCWAFLALVWFGCGVTAENSLDLEDPQANAMLANVANIVCDRNVLRKAETFAKTGAVSPSRIVEELRDVLPRLNIENVLVNGEFGSVETALDPTIDLQLRNGDQPRLVWVNMAFARPPQTGIPSVLERMFLQDSLVDDVGRECIPERNGGGEIVGVSLTTLSKYVYREQLCVGRHEPNHISDVAAGDMLPTVVLNAGQPLSDSPNETQFLRISSSFGVPGDIDAFSIPVHDAFTLPIGAGNHPQITIQVSGDRGAPVSAITATVDCGDRQPRLRCSDGSSGASCHADDSVLDVDLDCFVLHGDARLSVELVAALDLTTCTPYDLSITVR